MKNEQLILSLAQELKPIKPLWLPSQRFLTWAVLSILGVVLIALAVAPFRPDFVSQIIEHPRFLIETLFGVTAFTVCALAALKLCIPGAEGPSALKVAGLLCLAVWISMLVVGLWYPAIPPSMSGKRPYCFYETFIYAAPLLLVLLVMVRKGATINTYWAAALIGVAACAVPAVMMQVACMYIPKHVLTHHISPILIVGFLSFLLCRKLIRKL